MWKALTNRAPCDGLGSAIGRALALLGVVVAVFASPTPVAAETYDDCVRTDCANNPGWVMCGSTCRLRSYGAAAPAPRPPTLFGAIALDAGSLVTGEAKGYSSRADAERRALAMCRRGGGSAAGCKVVEWAHNACLALSVSAGDARHDNAWGSAYSDDGWVSRRNAGRQCQSNGGGSCRVVTSFCTG